ncbi:vacuolar-sorting receptor 1-like [Macadamia integrifolia]|uniref:vacuolar-sorting receptor 1-like n=1 Tax=Macadamia integrifolia TaxID=60698 RepID=UPI001C528BA2|nr:vacuolar-sorting receptor 1-like [Macadamia integrifolia]
MATTPRVACPLMVQTPLLHLLVPPFCFLIVEVWNGQKAGAAAVLVAHQVYEPLMTSVKSSSGGGTTCYKDEINIPSAFINRSLGDNLKKALEKG